MFDGIEAVLRLEQMYSIPDLMAWAKISAMGYRLRIGNKDEPSKEIAKIKTFENYYRYLDDIQKRYNEQQTKTEPQEDGDASEDVS